MYPFTSTSPFDDFFELSRPSSFFNRHFASTFPFELIEKVPDRSTVKRSQDFWPTFPTQPGYQVDENEKTYTLSFDVPGVSSRDMTIQIDNNALHVKGGRKVQSDDGKEVTERKFEYRMTIGDNVDLENITANLENGVLHVTAPKKQVEKKDEVRKIQITEKATNGDSTMEVDKK